MGTASGNPTWQDHPSTATLITAAALENIETALDGLAAVGDVQFTVDRTGASTSLASAAFTTYPLDGTPSVNIGGGAWNGTTFIYTVPVAGLYLCLGAIRMADGNTPRSVALAIGTSNADASHVLWENMALLNGSGTSGRSGRQYSRLVRFAASDQVRMYIYSQGLTFPTHGSPTPAGQFMSIIKLAD